MDLVVANCDPAVMQPLSSPTNRSARDTDNLQASYLVQARASVRQVLNRYTPYLRAARTRPMNLTLQSTLKAEMDCLSITLNKLEQGVVRIAVFGLVSRGKSAVLNALMGQKLLPTGPLNGVTLEPRSVSWSLHSDWLPDTLIELIDTPGLDEIDGQARADMAREVSRQADLILFVVAGDITRTEYQALCDLRRAQKPLLLVFNKVDLYPDQTRQEIYQSLQQLAARTQEGEGLQKLLSANEIVLVAAEPAPLQVRVELPDGQVRYEWEAPPVQIDDLKQKIAEILEREGRTLMALNALVQAKEAETLLTNRIVELRQPEAEALIQRFVTYKAIAVALNPIAILDVFGGFVSDLAMIRALSELYGLPVTRHEAAQLWKTILLSSGGLLLTEVGSGLMFGIGKTATAAAAGVDSSAGISAYLGAAIAQGAIAGFGTYSVGRAIQVYLEQGCSWGSQGASTVVQEIFSQLDSKTIIYRLRQELSQQLGIF